MASILEQAADAIVTHLAAQTQGDGLTLNQTIIAAKKAFVSYALDDLKTDTTARVSVVAVDMEVAEKNSERTGTRGRVSWDYVIDIGVHRAVASDAEFFATMELYQQILDLFVLKRLPGFDSLYWRRSKMVTIGDPHKYREQGAYLAVQRLTFGGQR
jgi:hypothetical protein